MIILQIIDLTIGLRLSKDDEIIGPDVLEHGGINYDLPTPTTSLESLSTIATVEDGSAEMFKTKLQETFKDLFYSANR